MNILCNKIINNRKSILCYLLLFIGLVLLGLVLIIKPQKVNENYMYNTGKETKKVELPKNIIQYIKPGVNNITGLYVYLEDDSITKCNFHIVLTDDNNNKYLDEDIKKYNSNIIYLSLGKIEKSKDRLFKLKIDLLNCSELKGMLGKSVNKYNYLDNYDKKTLKIVVNSVSKNNSYYWYIALIVSISLLLIPLARSENKNEK